MIAVSFFWFQTICFLKHWDWGAVIIKREGSSGIRLSDLKESSWQTRWSTEKAVDREDQLSESDAVSLETKGRLLVLGNSNWIWVFCFLSLLYYLFFDLDFPGPHNASSFLNLHLIWALSTFPSYFITVTLCVNFILLCIDCVNYRETLFGSLSIATIFTYCVPWIFQLI